VTAAVIDNLSEIVEGEEVASDVYGGTTAVRDWLTNIDVVRLLEAAVDLVKACLHSHWSLMSGNWTELVTLMDLMVTEIQGDGFWIILSDIMGRAAAQRWTMLDMFISSVVEPVVTRTVTCLEWIAEDVAGNLGVVADSIRNIDGPALIRHYSPTIDIITRQGQGQGLCEGEPEAIFPGLYSSVLHSLAVVEPTFSLLLPDSICMLFNVCNQAQSELGLALQSSQVTEAWHAIHSPLQRMGQALFCSPPQSLDTKYWDYVLA